MAKKVLASIFLLLLLTGCKATYKIKISNGTVTESFSTIEENVEAALVKDDTGRSFKDYSSLYVNEYPLYTSFYSMYADGECEVNCETYKKSLIDENNKVGFSLNYQFSIESYGDSALANELLPGFEAYYDGRYLKISGGNNWKFVNRYKNFENLKIEIETDYKVKKTNGKKEGNTYTWKINENSVDVDPSMYIVLDINEPVKEKKSLKIVFLLLGILILLGVLIACLLFKKNKEQNKL